MHSYCKAYTLGQFRQYSGWQRAEKDPTPSDASIGYLWDDFTVVKSPIQEKSIIFDAVTPEWQTFCEQTLQFTIPEDVRYTSAAPATPAQTNTSV